MGGAPRRRSPATEGGELLTRRARSAEAKQVRRNHILDAAVSLLARGSYDTVTMADIARTAGVAKGTPYLYWTSKEGLFLDALIVAYLDFTQSLVQGLQGLESPDEGDVGALISRQAQERPALLTLLGLLHGVLEHNADVEQVVAIKAQMLAGGAAVGSALQQVFGWLSSDRARRILLTVHGALISFHRMADLPDPIRLALEDPALAELRIDFREEVALLVRDLLLAARVDAGVDATG